MTAMLPCQLFHIAKHLGGLNHFIFGTAIRALAEKPVLERLLSFLALSYVSP